MTKIKSNMSKTSKQSWMTYKTLKAVNSPCLHPSQESIKKSPSNYMPVLLCKIMESVLVKTMTRVTERPNAMFSKAQHEFRPGRSCVTQLLEVIRS